MTSTRRIVAFNRVSADGYFTTPDGKLDWVVPDPELDREAARATSQSGEGMMLFGRRTYQQFESFWPKALDDSGTSPDPHSSRRSPDMRALAFWINEMPKVVFSKSRKDVTWKNSRLLREIDPREIDAMKQQPGEDILIFGSGSVASQLTELGLIDEYRFVVAPVLLGTGRPLIEKVSKRFTLDLVESKSYSSGNVMLRYVRKA